MSMPGWLARLAGSRHAGLAMKVARVLSALGTIRGAVTTVVLIASASGGIFTVQTVRSDLAAPRPTRPAPTQTASPSIDPSSLVLDAERRLQNALDNNNAAVDDLRKVAVLPPAQLDALIAEAKAKLQARYSLALTQINQLVGPTPPAATSPTPTPGFSVITLNTLVSVAMSDLSAIVFTATKVATSPFATPRPTATPLPTRTPSPTPVHTPTPLPIKTATPTPKL